MPGLCNHGDGGRAIHVPVSAIGINSPIFAARNESATMAGEAEADINCIYFDDMPAVPSGRRHGRIASHLSDAHVGRAASASASLFSVLLIGMS